MCPSQVVEPVDHSSVRPNRALQRLKTRGTDFDEAFCPAPTLWRGIAHSRGDEPFRFEPLQRRVECTRRDGAAGTRRELRPNSRAVCGVTEANDREQNELLELSEVHSSHLYCNVGKTIGLSRTR